MKANLERVYKMRYVCGPVAKTFHKDKASRVKLLIGPFGTGKTSSAAYDLIMLQWGRVLPDKDGIKRTRFSVIRNTFPQLRDTTIKTYLDWFPPAVWGKFNETEKRFQIRYNDRSIEILFRALDIEKDVRNLLSLELTGAHIDEAREVNNSIFKGLLGRVGRYPSMKDSAGENPFVHPVQVVLTTNYPSREHWIYSDFVGTPVDGYQIYKQVQDENKHNLRPGYYEDLEKDYANRPDLLRTLVRGDWGVTVRGKQVYTEFTRGFHVSEDRLLPMVVNGINAGNNTVVRGWDNTGLSPACVLTYVNSLGQWLVFEEIIGDDIGMVEFGNGVKTWCGQNLPSHTRYRDIGDPAGNTRDTTKQSPADYLRMHCNIVVENGIQTFKIRRESVVSRLIRQVQGEPSILIDPGCIRLIDGFEGGYAYPEIASTGIFKDEPDKNEYSHVHDALQYPATILFRTAGYHDQQDASVYPELVGDD
jgi:hypothetical protein